MASRARLGKAFASVVIVGCLAFQTLALVHPSDARFYPFIDYPMYSASWAPGRTYRQTELWVTTCADATHAVRASPVQATTLGYEDNDWLVGLKSTALPGSAAQRYRAHLSALAVAHLAPRPCSLAVWERTIPTTPRGVDTVALFHPHRTLVAEWPVANPAAVRRGPAAPKPDG